jgi:hypothetical protein
MTEISPLSFYVMLTSIWFMLAAIWVMLSLIWGRVRRW